LNDPDWHSFPDIEFFEWYRLPSSGLRHHIEIIDRKTRISPEDLKQKMILCDNLSSRPRRHWLIPSSPWINRALMASVSRQTSDLLWYKEPLLLWRIIIEGKKSKHPGIAIRSDIIARINDRHYLPIEDSIVWDILDLPTDDDFQLRLRFRYYRSSELTALWRITLELDRRKTGWRKGTQRSIGAS